MISIIVAASANNVIGDHGELPWRLRDDLRRFRQLTLGKPVVMGRRTWESIGRPLPGRQNIVLTRQPALVAAGCTVVASPGEALAVARPADEIMIIGGSQIYALFMPKAARVYLTRVQATVNGDACFPTLDDKLWQLVDSDAHAADAANQFAYEFKTYERRGRS